MKNHSPQFLKLVQSVLPTIKTCTVDDVRRSIEANEIFAMVDVREESEFAAGHAANAVHLGKGIIERDIEKTFPDPQSKLILYCGGGFRSALVCDNLQKMGYANVHSMDGGWSAWTAASMPTAK